MLTEWWLSLASPEPVEGSKPLLPRSFSSTTIHHAATTHRKKAALWTLQGI